MHDPVYDGHWAEIILHSDREGRFRELWIDPAFRPYVAEEQIWYAPGELVERFSGANKAVGTLVLNFPDRGTMEKSMASDDWYKVVTV